MVAVKVAGANPPELGDFVEGVYQAEAEGGRGEATARLIRTGRVGPPGEALPVHLAKEVVLRPGKRKSELSRKGDHGPIRQWKRECLRD